MFLRHTHRRWVASVLLGFWLSGAPGGAPHPGDALAPASFLGDSKLREWIEIYRSAITQPDNAEVTIFHGPDRRGYASVPDFGFGKIYEDVRAAISPGPERDAYICILDATGIERTNALVGGKPDALQALQIVALHLLYRHRDRPFDAASMRRFDLLRALYNRHAHKQIFDLSATPQRRDLQVRPLSRALVFVESTGHFVPQDEQVWAAYVELSSRLNVLPHSDAQWAAALNLFFIANHLSNFFGEDRVDIQIAATHVQFLIGELQKDPGGEVSQAMKIGLVRFLMWFDQARFTRTDEKTDRAVKAIKTALFKNAGEIRKWADEILQIAEGIPNDNVLKKDPFLAGLKWAFWKDVEEAIREVPEDPLLADVSLDRIFLTRNHSHFNQETHRIVTDSKTFSFGAGGYDAEAGAERIKTFFLHLDSMIIRTRDRTLFHAIFGPDDMAPSAEAPRSI